MPDPVHNPQSISSPYITQVCRSVYCVKFLSRTELCVALKLCQQALNGEFRFAVVAPKPAHRDSLAASDSSDVPICPLHSFPRWSAEQSIDPSIPEHCLD